MNQTWQAQKVVLALLFLPASEISKRLSDYFWSWEFTLILFLSSIPWEHHSYSEHKKCHVLLLVYISNSNGLDLVIFMKSTSKGYPDAYPEAALECIAIMPAEFLSQLLYVPVNWLYRSRNPTLLSSLCTVGIEKLPGMIRAGFVMALRAVNEDLLAVIPVGTAALLEPYSKVPLVPLHHWGLCMSAAHTHLLARILLGNHPDKEQEIHS